MLIADPALPDQERVKLLDFGIAKLANDTLGPAKQRTVTGRLIGTPRYMSPEQCRGQRDLDGKSDVYSLGVMLYELLSGQPPFVGMSEYDILSKHLYDPPLPLDGLRPSLSQPLVALIHRMLEKKKESRPDIKEVFAELSQYRRAPPTEGVEPAVPTPTAVARVSVESNEPTDSGVAPAGPPPPKTALAPSAVSAAPTVRAPTVRRKPAAPPGAKAAPPTMAEPTLIAGGPNAATVPVAVLSRAAQAKWQQQQQLHRQLMVGGGVVAVLLVLIVYLLLR